MQRWLRAGCFERIVEDVQSLLRQFGGRKRHPAAVCLDSRTSQSTPESGARAGYDGAKRNKGSKVHIAVDTLGHLMALAVTPADQGDRSQVDALAQQIQQVTGDTVELAYVDQGYTGSATAEAAQQHGCRMSQALVPTVRLCRSSPSPASALLWAWLRCWEEFTIRPFGARQCVPCAFQRGFHGNGDALVICGVATGYTEICQF